MKKSMREVRYDHGRNAMFHHYTDLLGLKHSSNFGLQYILFQ